MKKLQMKSSEQREDGLIWIMRFMGAVLAAVSAYMLTSDIFYGPLSTGFFGLSAGLGVVLIVTSLLPVQDSKVLQESALPLESRKRS